MERAEDLITVCNEIFNRTWLIQLIKSDENLAQVMGAQGDYCTPSVIHCMEKDGCWLR